MEVNSGAAVYVIKLGSRIRDVNSNATDYSACLLIHFDPEKLFKTVVLTNHSETQ